MEPRRSLSRHSSSIGVLFRLCIEIDGSHWFRLVYSIYQGHLFSQKATYGSIPLVALGFCFSVLKRSRATIKRVLSHSFLEVHAFDFKRKFVRLATRALCVWSI